MISDDILRMAQEAELLNPPDDAVNWSAPVPNSDYLQRLKRFAAIVAAAEREVCAKVCDELESANLYGVKECAAAIRSRDKK